MIVLRAITVLALLVSLVNPGAVTAVTASSEIKISEVLVGSVDSEGGATAEFIEIYNPTDEAIDLTGWKIQKAASG
ncbi:MAG: lamin tail domain-containing protein, partial [Candidatus Saccharimonadales bacterium]